MHSLSLSPSFSAGEIGFHGALGIMLARCCTRQVAALCSQRLGLPENIAQNIQRTCRLQEAETHSKITSHTNVWCLVRLRKRIMMVYFFDTRKGAFQKHAITLPRHHLPSFLKGKVSKAQAATFRENERPLLQLSLCDLPLGRGRKKAATFAAVV